jgi:uncharacterized protein (DUF433 family)
MIWPDFLTHDPGDEIRLTGHRINLYHVIDRCQAGYSPERLADEYPTLPPALIQKVIAFYLANQAGVDAYVAAYRAELERQEAAQVPSPALVESRRRVAARSRAETTLRPETP